jgi:hypothetical protein
MMRKMDSPSFVVTFSVQFWLALFAVIVVWSRIIVGYSYTKAVLPDLALIALNEKAIAVRLVIVTTLIFLEATNTARNLIFLIAGVIHNLVGVAV